MNAKSAMTVKTYTHPIQHSLSLGSSLPSPRSNLLTFWSLHTVPAWMCVLPVCLGSYSSSSSPLPLPLCIHPSPLGRTPSRNHTSSLSEPIWLRWASAFCTLSFEAGSHGHFFFADGGTGRGQWLSGGTWLTFPLSKERWKKGSFFFIVQYTPYFLLVRAVLFYRPSLPSLLFNRSLFLEQSLFFIVSIDCSFLSRKRQDKKKTLR